MRQSAAMLRLAERAPTRSGMEHKVEKRGGERGIRTPGTLAGTSDFESDAIDQLCHLSREYESSDVDCPQRSPRLRRYFCRSPQGPKKGSEHLTTFIGQHARRHSHAMIEPPIFSNLKQCSYRSGFGIATAIHQPSDPGIHQRTCTHRARLLGDVHCGITKSPASQRCRRLPNREHFRVGSRISQGFPTISTSTDNAITDNDHSTYGNFAEHASLSCFPKRQAHSEDIGYSDIWRTDLCRNRDWRTPEQAHQEGFEPPTLGFVGRCSIQLSYWCSVSSHFG